jgi:predicted membrane protein
MNEPTRPPISPSVVAGIVLIGLGILFTLSSFDVIDAGSLGDYWPLFLMVPGFISFVWPRKNADRFWGVILFGIGTLFLLRNLGIIWIRFRHVWPVVLLALGVYLIWRALEGRRPAGGSGSSGGPGTDVGQRMHDGAIAGLDAASPSGLLHGAPESSGGDRLDEFAVFGGGDRMLRSRSFRGGNVTAIMGGFDIDLRDADIAGDSARIEMFVLMGGVDLKVPESWTVVIDVTPFMGGADYSPGSRRPPAEGPQKVLTVSGFVCMGGIEVRH